MLLLLLTIVASRKYKPPYIGSTFPRISVLKPWGNSGGGDVASCIR